jgi:recombination protein RecR
MALIDDLTEALCCFPGIGPKSAQRIVLHLLQHDRAGAARVAELLAKGVEAIGNCRHCRDLSEFELCVLCQDPRRDDTLLCVVETPADVHSIERAGGYKGRYFVLLGRLSPLDGITPEDLGLELLAKRLDQGTIREVILATGATLEGEATAHYIGDMVRERKLSVTRIAHGVPMGGELEYLDSSTLAHAIRERRPVEF